MSDDRLRELYAIAQAGRPAGPDGEHPAPEDPIDTMPDLERHR